MSAENVIEIPNRIIKKAVINKKDVIGSKCNFHLKRFNSSV